MSKCGLVLSGGGARGAYEAGILYYLLVDGPRELREMVHFDVISGTSIGALTASALAASVHQPAAGVRRMVDLWRTLELERVLQLSVKDMLSIPGWLVGRTQRESIFPGGPVEQLLIDSVDWNQIHVNLEDGLLDALSISCTQVSSGKTLVFYETADGKRRPFSRDPNVVPVRARLEPHHALASSSIPFVFPPVSIDGISYVDGGLRQNTPLSPALRMGSEKLLVIGLGHAKEVDEAALFSKEEKSTPISVLGKVVNALMLDHVDYDIVRLSHVNRLMEDGETVFGEQFIDRLNQMVKPIRGASYRKIPHVVMRPSMDLGMLAAQHVRDRKMKSSKGVVTRLVRTLARLERKDEADLTSYLLFDGDFCESLINLAMDDARAAKDELLRLFDAK